MKRWIIVGVTAVGFVSGLVSLTQAFGFTQIPRLDVQYSCFDGSRNSVLEFVAAAHKQVGAVIWLDAQVCAGRPDKPPFERRAEARAVSWRFDPCTLAQQVGRQCAFAPNDPSQQTYWSATKRMVEARLSTGEVNYDQIEKYLLDNGTAITLLGVGQEANPYTSFEIETEGSDEAHGPFQVSMSNRDGNRRIRLSPAPFTTELPKQVRCVRRKWPSAVKWLLCPLM